MVEERHEKHEGRTAIPHDPVTQRFVMGRTLAGDLELLFRF
jgi:hypothetical protein